jgi:metal-sulfur cluster biosynthetic enzyme
MSSQPGTNRPTWEVETSNPELMTPLKEALSTVVDPELGFNILQLGLVRDVIVQDERAILKMILTTPFCPYGPAMLESTRQTAEKALERPVFMDLSMDPWDFSMMEEGIGGDWGLF